MSVPAAGDLRRDIFVMGLVGVAHGSSHFFQLVLPPLFPFLIQDFAVSYTELGVLMTVFFVSSGVGQPFAGFLVDRFGARRVMLIGLGAYVVSIFAVSFAPAFWMMFPILAIAGLGNCVFHPADFTILNASVRSTHLGRAFGVHTLGGNLGWAVAPALMLLIAGLLDWRWALRGAAAVGALVWLTVWFNRARLGEAIAPVGRERQPLGPMVSVLFSAPILLCFGYFLLLAAALIAVQNFLPPILGKLHATPLVLAGSALTGFLLGASLGVLAGGLLADRSRSHTTIILIGLSGAALVFVLIAHVNLAAAVLIGAVSAAGFLSGITTPSRDLLVRAATPSGATGRVFGFVYSGLDVGSALAPITVGLVLDHGNPQWALWAVAAFLLAAIFTAVSIRGTLLTSLRPAVG